MAFSGVRRYRPALRFPARTGVFLAGQVRSLGRSPKREFLR